MEWFLICHGMVTLTVVVSFLCGQWSIFNNTPIQWIHPFLTFAAYDYFLRFVAFVFGAKDHISSDCLINILLNCKILLYFYTWILYWRSSQVYEFRGCYC
ncbi:putative protein S-acyltransferase 17 [Cardamine amara subsp. amara]|uniref:Uncharacterized protein n=1 Tax=Cardamine amara subsp. amara TaxID=228776 RepID=A0ABD1BNI6_CARAN